MERGFSNPTHLDHARFEKTEDAMLSLLLDAPTAA
jgi:hypothetical protein